MSLTNRTEQLLHQIRIPITEFAQSDINGILEFLNHEIKRLAKTVEEIQITIAFDRYTQVEFSRYDKWEGGGGPHYGPFTFGGLDMSVLEVIQILQKVAQLDRNVEGRTLILSMKKEE